MNSKRYTLYKFAGLPISKIVPVLVIGMRFQHKNISKYRRPWLYPTQIIGKYKAYDDPKVILRKLG